MIVIGGPTAVGKTAAAIQLAKHLGTEIISADSRQCYKELKIGVARPSDEELQEVPHYFIASHSIQETVTAATFEAYALEKVSLLFQKYDTVVMVGGTGLYIKAFCEGLDRIPEIPSGIREEIIQKYETEGLGWLQRQVEQEDPAFYAVGEILNPHRLTRALEVVRATGRSVLEFRKGKKAQRSFEIRKIALELPKEVLRRHIDHRVDAMIAMGLVEEVRELLPYKHLNALKTVGYKEIFDYLDGICTLEEAVSAIKTNTRHYAKRQMTWFRKDPEFEWMSAEGFSTQFISKNVD